MARPLRAQVLLRARGDCGGWARPVAMALAWEACVLRQRDIGRAFGVSPYTVSKAIAHAAVRAASKGKTGKLIRTLNSNFKG